MIKPLRGANALLTGGSQGLGPHFARALAGAGVNLALTARSADKLTAVAQELTALGVRAVALPADVTRAEDRERVAAEAQAALGPIDILINNAGVELNGRFTRKTPAEIDQIHSTNFLAPVNLTRLLLPGMLERRRGHIVNLGSIAGKAPIPYGTLYGASKAALMSWSTALRVELEGTGVSVSTLSPGLVAETGVFAYHQTRPHFLIGETTPAAVVRGLMRALQHDTPEVIVDPRFFWLIQISLILSLSLTIKLNQLVGLKDWLRRTYDGA